MAKDWQQILGEDSGATITYHTVASLSRFGLIWSSSYRNNESSPSARIWGRGNRGLGNAME